jgi:hypothetical protein
MMLMRVRVTIDRTSDCVAKLCVGHLPAHPMKMLASRLSLRLEPHYRPFRRSFIVALFKDVQKNSLASLNKADIKPPCSDNLSMKLI